MKKIILSLLCIISLLGCNSKVKYPNGVDLTTESEFLNTFNNSAIVDYNEYKIVDQDSTTIVLTNMEKNLSIYLTNCNNNFLAKMIDNSNGNVYKFKGNAKDKLYKIYRDMYDTQERYILTQFNKKLKENK